MSELFKGQVSRRELLRGAAVGVAAVLAGCAPKVVEKIVKETVVVKEMVKETVIVAGTPQVAEKEVTKIVEKVVEKVVEKQVTAVPAKKPVVEIRINRSGFAPWHEIVHKQFEEEQPNIKLKLEPSPDYWTKIRTLFAGGRLGDVFWTWQENGDFNEYANAGMISPLQDFVDAEKLDLAVYFDSALKLFYVEGKLMLIPEYAHPGPTGVYFNKAMCDEAGLTYVPETNAREAAIYDDWTQDQFVDVMVKLTKRGADGKVSQWGYSRGTGFHQQVSMMRRFGGDALAPDAKTVTVDSEESIAGIKFVSDLFHVHKVWPTPDVQEDSGLNMFTGGQKMATYCHGVWSAVNVKRRLDGKFEHGSTLIPRHAELNTRGLILSTGGNVISTLSKNRAEAWEYCKFMGSHYVGTQRTIAGGAGPGGRPDCWYDQRVQSYDRVLPKFAELIPLAEPHVIPWNARAKEYQDAINQNIQRAWIGQVSAEEACGLAAEAARKVMAKDPA